MLHKHARVWLDINLSTLKDNFKIIKEKVEPCEVLSVLKANAYGLGVQKIASALASAGTHGFGVAEINEALALLPLGKPVQILGGILPDEIPDAVRGGIIIPVTDYRTARIVSAEAIRQRKTAECHFLVDTGMGRLGIRIEEAEKVISDSHTLPHIKFTGIYSHFPAAYIQDCEYTNAQIKSFKALLRGLADKGIRFNIVHIANSDAVNNYPKTYMKPFNMVRTGINLHGSFDPQGQRTMNLKSIITLKTRLVAVRKLPAGASIGYGCTYKLPEDAFVGTISAGYADGLPLALSNRGHVLIRGKSCHIIGRVSMDCTTVSLAQIPGAECGDEVICLGGEGPLAVSVAQWAQVKGTHAYDIICSFGSRVIRKYIDPKN
jgi:alanine racemase